MKYVGVLRITLTVHAPLGDMWPVGRREGRMGWIDCTGTVDGTGEGIRGVTHLNVLPCNTCMERDRAEFAKIRGLLCCNKGFCAMSRKLPTANLGVHAADGIESCLVVTRIRCALGATGGGPWRKIRGDGWIQIGRERARAVAEPAALKALVHRFAVTL